MKTSGESEDIRWIFLNPCVGIPGRDSIKMVSILGTVFAAFYVFHGAYLCATSMDVDRIFGIIYIISGLSFWSMSCLLWLTAEKPTLKRYRIWIGTSIILFFLTLPTTLSRSLIRNGSPVWSANIWILCGAFLQSYMTWVIWSFMKNFQTTLGSVDQVSKKNHVEERL